MTAVTVVNILRYTNDVTVDIWGSLGPIITGGHNLQFQQISDSPHFTSY